MKMPNLGIVVPVAAATGIGLRRARQLRWPWRERRSKSSNPGRGECSTPTLSSKGGRMADHPNVERLRRGYEAYARGDLATLRGMFADTITFHFHGLSEVLGYFERLPEIGAARFEVHDLLADDEHGVALLAGTAERTGERIEQKVVHVFHLNADGQVTEWWNFWEDQEALDDLLA
jgi:ketosteroid isomerase-like protein